MQKINRKIRQEFIKDVWYENNTLMYMCFHVHSSPLCLLLQTSGNIIYDV
jgi:hypothetical protein